MNEQLQAAFDKKFKDTWFFEDVPLNHKTPATTGRTHNKKWDNDARKQLSHSSILSKPV